MDIKVRIATLEDLPELLKFEQGIIDAERPFDSTLKSNPINYYDLGQIIRNSDSEVLVATNDALIIASGHVRVKQGENYNSFDKYAFLGFMYVAPLFRGKGINKLIIDGLLNWASNRNLKEVRLKVYSENDSAVKAYEKIGFKPLMTEMRLEI